MSIQGGSLLNAILMVNNRYQEMSGIMINESFNPPASTKCAGDWRQTILSSSKAGCVAPKGLREQS